MSETHKKIGDALFAMTDAAEKKYVRCGIAYLDDRGQVCIKLNTLPRNMHEWTGWINVKEDKFDRKEPA